MNEVVIIGGTFLFIFLIFSICLIITQYKHSLNFLDFLDFVDRKLDEAIIEEYKRKFAKHKKCKSIKKVVKKVINKKI